MSRRAPNGRLRAFVALVTGVLVTAPAGAVAGATPVVSTRKGGGFHGYKINMAVRSATELPLAWNVRTHGTTSRCSPCRPVDALRERGFAVERCAMDNDYDLTAISDGCAARDCRPIIPLRQTKLACALSRARAVTTRG